MYSGNTTRTAYPDPSSISPFRFLVSHERIEPSKLVSSLGLAWSHVLHDCQGGKSWESEQSSQRWAPLELSRRDVDYCQRRVMERFFGRGGCSFLLLFLLPLVIIVLSSLSSTSSSPLQHLHFFPGGNSFVKRLVTQWN